MFRTAQQFYLVDSETGEAVVIPVGTAIKTPEELEKSKKKRDKREENIRIAKWTNGNSGNFFWYLFQPCQNCSDKINNRLLVDILYLVSYMDYNTDRLVIGSKKKKPMSKTDVKRIIKGHKKDFSVFWSAVIRTGIIQEEQNDLVVTSNFSRGSLNLNGRIAVKIFVLPLRQLYEKSNVSDRSCLAYVFRLIPYTNIAYNVVCKNPLEKCYEKIEPLTLKEMCEALQVDVRNQTKIMRKLQSLSFIDKNGTEKYVVKLALKSKKRKFMLINPQFFSGYMSADTLSELDKEFVKKE